MSAKAEGELPLRGGRGSEYHSIGIRGGSRASKGRRSAADERLHRLSIFRDPATSYASLGGLTRRPGRRRRLSLLARTCDHVRTRDGAAVDEEQGRISGPIAPRA